MALTGKMKLSGIFWPNSYNHVSVGNVDVYPDYRGIGVQGVHVQGFFVLSSLWLTLHCVFFPPEINLKLTIQIFRGYVEFVLWSRVVNLFKISDLMV